MDVQSILVSLMGLAAGLTAGAPALEPTITGQFSNNTSLSEPSPINDTAAKQNTTEPDSNATASSGNTTLTADNNQSTGTQINRSLNGTTSEPENRSSFNSSNSSAPTDTQLQKKQNTSDSSTAGSSNLSAAENSTYQNRSETSENATTGAEKTYDNASYNSSEGSSQNVSFRLSQEQVGMLRVSTNAKNPVWLVNGTQKSDLKRDVLYLSQGPKNVTLNHSTGKQSSLVDIRTNGTALIDNEFYMFKYEASRSDATAQSEGSSNVPASRRGVEPWNNISQTQAKAACGRLGRRYSLPTDQQWYETLQTGTEQPSQLNGNTAGSKSYSAANQTCETSPQTEWNENYCLTGTGPSEWQTSQGVEDMRGNLWEWTAETVEFSEREIPQGKSGWFTNWRGYSPSNLTSEKPEQSEHYYYSSEQDGFAVRRGGAWFSRQKSGALSMKIDRTPQEARQTTGFRCVFEPKDRSNN